jgi:hypothetical protein
MTTLTFHLHLIGTEPLVTRTFKVSAKTTMYELHHIIQVVMVHSLRTQSVPFTLLPMTMGQNKHGRELYG